jgi:hypothetical protein
MSLDAGRPIVLRDENCVRLSRVLLNHPMVSPTDVRLISLVDLVAQKSKGPFTATDVGHLTRFPIPCSSNLRDSGTPKRVPQPQFVRNHSSSERSAGQLVQGMQRIARYGMS